MNNNKEEADAAIRDARTYLREAIELTREAISLMKKAGIPVEVQQCRQPSAALRMLCQGTCVSALLDRQGHSAAEQDVRETTELPPAA